MRLPILFLEDDKELIQIYEEFLKVKGYSSIIIRDGVDGMDQATTEGMPTLLMTKESKIRLKKNQPPVIIITRSKNWEEKQYELKPAIETGKIFSELKKNSRLEVD